MRKILFSIILIAVFCSPVYGESPNRTCASWGCQDLYAWIVADAVMALPGSAEASMYEKDEGSKNKGSCNWEENGVFVDGVEYAFCVKNNPSGCSWEKSNSNNESWRIGNAAAQKIISLFESEGVVIEYSMTNKIRDVIYIYRNSKDIGWKFSHVEKKKEAHQFNDNSYLSLEENIKVTIASAKNMIAVWDSKKDERKNAQTAKEEVRKADHARKLGDVNREIYKKVNAASKTRKGRLNVARQIMCNATRDYFDQTLDLRNPQGAMDREYYYNASRDIFFTLLESSGGNKYHRYSEPNDNYRRYCR